ncbi:MAG: peptide chain release factor N(5)-glutamine methyltransferase [Desulfobacterales bacterium]|jgi:release factor glutamine methyltransferase
MQNQRKPNHPEWKIVKLIQWAAAYFKTHGIDSPRSTAEILLAHVLHTKRIDLYLNYDQPLTDDELQHFKVLLKRRIKREPVAYIVGTKGFWSIDVLVSSDVLIPRPETECLVERAIAALSDDSSSRTKRILELGTGSGAVIVSLAAHYPMHSYFASEISYAAIQIAYRNARRHQLENKIHFFSGDWLAPLRLDNYFFDLILSNPPYIKTEAVAKLQPEIVAFEPIIALDGGSDGLDSIKQIVQAAHQYLKPGGTLMLEIAHDQKEGIHRIMTQCGHYDSFVCRKDYSGDDRIVEMRKKCCGTRHNLLHTMNF